MNPEPEKTRSGAAKEASILVTGDVVRDIYVYQGDRTLPAEPGRIEPHFSTEAGGAWALFSIIKQARSGVVFGLAEPLDEKLLPPVHTLWIPCEGGTRQEHEDAAKDAKPEKVWRVGESLGYSLSSGEAPAMPRSSDAGELRDVIVIDDAALSFRSLRSAASWPAVVRRSEPQPVWIVHKMANPIAKGDLWRALIGGASEPRRSNLIVIVSADELRRAGAAISRGLSWERTLSELCHELNHNSQFQPLLQHAQRLIVNFGCVGAIWFAEPCGTDQATARERATLVYDPALPEGDWKTLLQDDHPVFGHMNTFTAAIALAAAHEGAKLDLSAAIERGLLGCRQLRLLGHGPVSGGKPGLPLGELKPLLAADSMPADATKSVRKKLIPGGFQIVSGICRDPAAAAAGERSLAGLAENPHDQPCLPLYGLGHRVALYGVSALQHIPHAKFGDLLSIDRQEIETLRSLRKLIRRYEKDKKHLQPLSIAAFGPPGAGKSFGIKQIAKEILGKDAPLLEFNLSQFDAPEDLFGAFHQVRDRVLKGSIPVIFWDEFDSREYKWLQYLLAPMQDGTFEEKGHTHALGRCIFVFAGGTSWDFEHFGPAPMPPGWLPVHDLDLDKAAECADPAVAGLAGRYLKSRGAHQAADASANADFRRKKGPDFLSRLDGYINVLGPNRRMSYDWGARAWAITDETDITFPVRRALLLRQFLGAKKLKDQLQIDRDLLRAFIHIPRYSHGARSMEKAAKPMAMEKGRPFRRAQLPPPQVLVQHLGVSQDFDRIYRQNEEFLDTDNLNRIAAAIDENYQRLTDKQAAEKAARANTPHQPRRDKTEAEFTADFLAKSSSADPWEQWQAATNRAAAHRLPWLLDLAGLRFAKGEDTPAAQDAVSEHLRRHLQTLAAEEHHLWMEFHFDNGWQLPTEGQQKQLEAIRKSKGEKAREDEVRRLKKEDRRHLLLAPFRDLPADQQAKDHDAITHLPGMAALVGWKIEFATP